jgi:hypothetical protein
MDIKARQVRASVVSLLWMDAEPRIEERAGQPSPDGALVVRPVAGAQIAVVLRLEIGMTTVQGAEAVTHQKPFGDKINDRRPS